MSAHPPPAATSERRIATAFGLSALAALGLAGVYVRGGQPQLEGALLAVSLGSLGVGMVLWARDLFPQEEAVAQRQPLASEPEEVRAFTESFEEGEEQFERRRFLTRMMGGAFAALALAAVFPIRSLGPNPGRALFQTAWRRGSRLVVEGHPVRIGDLPVGGILTVFPEGHEAAEDAATVLIRVAPEDLPRRSSPEGWAPEGHVAYSKICTHVGCPVGLYQEATNQLVCPCHQSTFAVLDDARPVLGPATRPLPQLPLGVDAEGYLVALSDYQEPVGPVFWNRDRT